MHALVYALTLPIVFVVSRLPFWLLYRLSDVLFVLVYHVLRVRRDIVARQLRASFPDRTDRELARTARSYYRYLCDLVLEVVKSLDMSADTMRRRCPVDDRAILDGYDAEGRSVVAVLGHYGNWEWAALTSALFVRQRMVVIYKPLRNPYFDRLFARNRSRFGVELVPMKQVGRFYVENRRECFVACFVADQAPRRTEGVYWTEFLHQDTAVHRGAESLARKFDHPVIFVTPQRVRRGHYRIRMERLVTDPTSTVDGEITERHVRRLEKLIRHSPETWLWSHRRWKRGRTGA